MNELQLMRKLAEVEGHVSVHEGVLHFEDGTSVDLSALLLDALLDREPRRDDMLRALKGMVDLWDDNHSDEKCACLGASPDCPSPPPCELCVAREAIAMEQKDKAERLLRAEFSRRGWRYRGQGLWTDGNQVLSASEVRATLRLCSDCGVKPALDSYATCKECHDKSLDAAESFYGVQ